MNALIHRKYGKELWEEAFRFSIHLRKKLLKNLRFIRPFLPPIVHGRKWEEADDKEIMNDPAFFSISKDYAWHGFSHAEDGLSMIDPCKILLTSGSLKEYKEGIPACPGKMDVIRFPDSTAPSACAFLSGNRIKQDFSRKKAN